MSFARAREKERTARFLTNTSHPQAANLVEEHAERGIEGAAEPFCKYLSNRAAALLRVGCTLEALAACDKILMHDPRHDKVCGSHASPLSDN